MPISRMQNPRQLYGLGSLVKKITRPIKKIFKSPIGKAAMLGLGAYGLGGGFGAGGFKFGNLPGFGSLFGGKALPPSMGFKSKGLFSGLSNIFGKGSIGKGAMALGLGGGLASMLAKQPEEEEEEYIDRIRTLKPYLSKYYKNANPLASDEEVEEFLTTNLSEYGEGGAKDGGLIGYAKGGSTGNGNYGMEGPYEGFHGYHEDGSPIRHIDLYDSMEDFLEFNDPQTKKPTKKKRKKAAEGGLTGDDELALKMFGKTFDELSDKEKDFIYYKENMAEGGPVDEEEIADQETITEDVPTPTGMEKLQETLTEVAKVLYRATPVGAAMFTYDEAKKIYDGLPDISKEMIHRIGKTVAMMTPLGMASAGAKGLATLLRGGMEEGEAQDLLGHREKRKRKAEKKDKVGDLIDQGASFEEAVDITTRQGAATGGLMDLGGYEKDYRMGGFVPLGKKEKADDVPARLSKNEFVFTADAVRAAGGGSVDKGAQKMYDTMKRLENRVA